MQTQLDRQFGTMIMRLIQKEDLSRNEARDAFLTILEDRTTEMQQGAFLSALTAKGETEEEVAGAWEAIYELDTEHVSLNGQTPLFENSGTGMGTFKTFNISTAASIIAASGGIRMARHGARAITSVCGTVDMAEALGVDVECDADVVAESIEKAGRSCLVQKELLIIKSSEDYIRVKVDIADFRFSAVSRKTKTSRPIFST